MLCFTITGVVKFAKLMVSNPGSWLDKGDYRGWFREEIVPLLCVENEYKLINLYSSLHQNIHYDLLNEI